MSNFCICANKNKILKTSALKTGFCIYWSVFLLRKLLFVVVHKFIFATDFYCWYFGISAELTTSSVRYRKLKFNCFSIFHSPALLNIYPCRGGFFFFLFAKTFHHKNRYENIFHFGTF